MKRNLGVVSPMGIATWLKERRLERTHRKLKHLRAFQSRLRDQEAELHEQLKRGAPSTELEAKERKLHEDRDRITREIKTLQAEEDKLKTELKPAA